MEWNTFGSYEVYINTTGRICARVFKHEKGFGALLTPVNPPKDFDGFLGYYVTLEQAKNALEESFA